MKTIRFALIFTLLSANTFPQPAVTYQRFLYTRTSSPTLPASGLPFPMRAFPTYASLEQRIIADSVSVYRDEHGASWHRLGSVPYHALIDSSRMSISLRASDLPLKAVWPLFKLSYDCILCSYLITIPNTSKDCALSVEADVGYRDETKPLLHPEWAGHFRYVWSCRNPDFHHVEFLSPDGDQRHLKILSATIRIPC